MTQAGAKSLHGVKLDKKKSEIVSMSKDGASKTYLARRPISRKTANLWRSRRAYLK